MMPVKDHAPGEQGISKRINEDNQDTDHVIVYYQGEPEGFWHGEEKQEERSAGWGSPSPRCEQDPQDGEHGCRIMTARSRLAERSARMNAQRNHQKSNRNSSLRAMLRNWLRAIAARLLESSGSRGLYL